MADRRPADLEPISIENAEFLYSINFEGREEGYNRTGKREFNVKISADDAEELTRRGWNIKWSQPGKNHPNPDEHVSEPYLKVSVGYKFRPPTIVLIKDGKPSYITEDTIALVDSTEFSNVDMVITGSWYDVDGTTGYKAWLKEMYGTVVMTDMAKKYAWLDNAGSSEDDS